MVLINIDNAHQPWYNLISNTEGRDMMRRSIVRVTKESLTKRINELSERAYLHGAHQPDKVFRAMKKDEVVANYRRLCNAIEYLQAETDAYIEYEVEERCKKSVDAAEKYEKMYIELREENNRLQAQIEYLKKNRRKEGGGRPPKYTDDDVKAVKADHAEGLSIRTIAEKRKMSTRTVQKLLHK